MYGYCTPKRPELHDVRIMVRESEIQAFQQRYPALLREQIIAVMMTAGPERKPVEAALARLAGAPRPT